MRMSCHISRQALPCSLTVPPWSQGSLFAPHRELCTRARLDSSTRAPCCSTDSSPQEGRPPTTMTLQYTKQRLQVYATFHSMLAWQVREVQVWPGVQQVDSPAICKVALSLSLEADRMQWNCDGCALILRFHCFISSQT